MNPGETAVLEWRIRTERRSSLLLPDRLFEAKPSKVTVQPFDLMSRRHPLSSIGATRVGPIGSNDAPAKETAGFSKSGETYFFFLATLRVFFAVFFTALFAFFAFFAFLAMLPSDVSEMA